jgi:glycosyltransferase involved in cell wall biosynthesis
VYFWNLARLPVSLALRAEARGAVCYYVSDPWLAKWTEEGWYEDRWYRANSVRARHPLSRGLIRSAFRLSRLTWTTNDLQLRHVQFCSAFLKQATLEAGRPVADGDVVHWGVNTAMFTPERTSHPEDDRSKRLLYVGQLLPHKGVHTAIEALGRLRAAGARDLTLTIVGRCHEPDYDARLRQTVAAMNLVDAVRFDGPQPRERLPDIYRAHGVLVFPSCWDEPFAITPLEAMASELAVVGTTAGGNREIFDDEVNALTFPPEDSDACAARSHRLATDPELCRNLAGRGRSTVLQRFTLRGMVDRIESGLHRATNAPQQASEGTYGS